MNKVLTVNQAISVSKKLKEQRKTIILVGGCFDILHIGHIEFLERAKKSGDVLMLLLEHDLSVQKKKGIRRPIHTQAQRARILSKNQDVDYLVLLPYIKTDRDYRDLVKKIKPDIIAITKGDPQKKNKSQQATMIHAKLIEVMENKRGFSSTAIIKRILDTK